MRNIGWKVALIVAVLALCLWQTFPVEENIRLGKDLRGGVSLVYALSMPEGVDKAQVLNQTISVVKERINPDGVFDISITPLGNDRFEVVMPLPSEQVQELRAEYEAAKDALLKDAEIKLPQLDEAVRAGLAVERFGGADAASIRYERVAALQSAYDAVQATKGALAAAIATAADSATLAPLEQAVADAEVAYTDARDNVARLGLDRARLERTMNLPTKREVEKDENGKNVIDPETGDAKLRVSQRDAAIEVLKSEFPHIAQGIDRVVTAFDAYKSKRVGLDDPDDLKRLMRGAGVLEFRIAVRENSAEGLSPDDLRQQLAENGPDNTDSPTGRWFPINDIKQWYKKPAELVQLEDDPETYFSSRYGLSAAKYDGRVYLLLYTTSAKSMTHSGDRAWSIERAFPTTDQLGRQAVSFRLDNAGGSMMARLTGPHVNQPMAIVLDGQVYSAPNLNSQIGSTGVIEGEFSTQEINYLIRVLTAGSLQARLSPEPIAMSVLGPSLGMDNLVRGLWACLLSVIITAMIMFVYYFFAGAVANIALIANTIMIFGIMALMDGTFTMPGLAGIALSIAMAVDANVLIYERIREEVVNNGENLRNAIRLGYARAMNAIIDGNVAHLITCVVLLYTATTEVKGFAVTMILGVIATLFTALFITRVIFAFYTEAFKFRSLPMLPTVFPGIHRSLEPSVNWIRLRGVFTTISLIAVVASLALFISKGRNMLDTEFRGGVSAVMQTREARDGEPKSASDGRLLLSRPEVESRVRAIGERAGEADPVLYELRNASVLTVGTADQQFRSSTFQIKVSNPTDLRGADEDTIADSIVQAIAEEFGPKGDKEGELDVQLAHTFDGSALADRARYEDHTYAITSEKLGTVINRPDILESVSEFKGGVAVVLNNISPPLDLNEAAERITTMRLKDYADTQSRQMRVVGLDRINPLDLNSPFKSAAVLVFDPEVSYQKVEPELWDQQLASREWRLVSTALSEGAQLQQVSSFSSAIARTLAANAVVAVILSLLGMLLYIWIRFGSLRYSFAAITALTHNVIICLGALALTHYLSGTAIASWLRLEEYRIDLNVIAALLTIIGYSLNDTIVILDRIRENRGKRPLATPEMVNLSINQTFSRTILTGGSTILASIILYVMGGPAIQPFAYTFLIGLLVGTYSSVTIAAPMVVGGPPAGEAGGALVPIERAEPAGLAPATV